MYSEKPNCSAGMITRWLLIFRPRDRCLRSPTEWLDEIIAQLFPAPTAWTGSSHPRPESSFRRRRRQPHSPARGPPKSHGSTMSNQFWNAASFKRSLHPNLVQWLNLPGVAPPPRRVKHAYTIVPLHWDDKPEDLAGIGQSVKKKNNPQNADLTSAKPSRFCARYRLLALLRPVHGRCRNV
jgi:hypothetical protein